MNQQRPIGKRKPVIDRASLTPREARLPYRLVGSPKGWVLTNDHTGDRRLLHTHNWEHAVTVLREENHRHITKS